MTGALLVGSTLWAQSKAPDNLETRQADHQKAHDTAVSLFASGKDDQAEDALTAPSRQKKDSAGWHLETAGQLVQESFLLNRQGDFAGAGRIARRALSHTDQAVKKSKADEKDLAASAQKLAAFINERLLADLPAAKASLRAAMAALPGDPDADRSLKRLERIEAEAAKKTSGDGK